jgi:voltage-gated potassium channel
LNSLPLSDLLLSGGCTDNYYWIVGELRRWPKSEATVHEQEYVPSFDLRHLTIYDANRRLDASWSFPMQILAPSEVVVLFTGITITFLKEFGLGQWLTCPLWLTSTFGIMARGRIAGRKECWAVFDSFYWSCLTATTVGCGAIRPWNKTSRILAIIIALLGLVFTGIVIAVAVHAATFAPAAHDAATRVR